MSSSGSLSGGGDANVLLKAIAAQSERLRTVQKVHGEFHERVSDDLKQLALLLVMNGEHDKALPLLHQRLVIHEKFGPESLAAEALQELGTVYRLHGVAEISLQHLLRALALREKCHGKNSLKVAETLNSLALVCQMQNDPQQAETYQLRSLQVLYESAEPEDIESEDIPWEVYKRLKQQRGPSTAANSITLLKGNMRKSVMDVVYKSSTKGESTDETEGLRADESTSGASSGEQSPVNSERRRVSRSQSETAMNSSRGDKTNVQFRGVHGDGDGTGVIHKTRDTEADPVAVPHMNLPLSQSLRSFPPHFSESSGNITELPPTETASRYATTELTALASPSIRDFPALQQRVESVKRRILAGYPDVDADMARLAADVNLVEARELREVGLTLVSMVREMKSLSIRTDLAQQQLPVLEGMLEKKSASIFRGWEKRWFRVDPKTFILSYHFSKDDYARGFTPRGGFAASRISNILVQRHARGSYFHFDVVVDLSTRLNPQGSRTYELRCEDEESLRYWVETLHYYKAMAQKSPPRPSTS